MKKLRLLYYAIFATYRETDEIFVTYSEAAILLGQHTVQREFMRWRIARREDHNLILGRVWLARRERVRE